MAITFLGNGTKVLERDDFLKIKTGYVKRIINGRQLIIPLTGRLNNDCIIELNESAAVLWDQLGSDISEVELITALADHYSIDTCTATQAVISFINCLKEYDILEV